MGGIYDRLSRYDADEGVVIAYGSMYGNTEQMAEAIAEELSAQGVKTVSYTHLDVYKRQGSNGIILSMVNSILFKIWI